MLRTERNLHRHRSDIEGVRHPLGTEQSRMPRPEHTSRKGALSGTVGSRSEMAKSTCTSSLGSDHSTWPRPPSSVHPWPRTTGTDTGCDGASDSHTAGHGVRLRGLIHGQGERVRGKNTNSPRKLAASQSVPGVTGEDPFDASRVAGVEVLTALDDCSAVAARVGLRCSVISNIRWPIEHRY
jgi:hypothetical protein